MSNSKSYSNWAGGANNQARPDRLPEGQARELLNLDPLPDGSMRLRPGYVQRSAQPLRGAIVYRDGFLAASGTSLLQYQGSTNSVLTLGTIESAGFFAGAVLNDEAFVCTPSRQYRVRGSTAYNWTAPAVGVAVTMIDGAFAPGRYFAAVTLVDEIGVEHGCVPSVFDVPEGKVPRLLFTVPAGYTARLYQSVANDDTLFLQGEVTGTVTLTSSVDDTQRLLTGNLMAPPTCPIVKPYKGRLVMANANVLYVTEPFAPHLHHRIRGMSLYPEAITDVAPTEGGVFVLADKTYFVSNLGMDSVQQEAKLEFGGIAGSAALLPDGRATWFTKYGQVFASPGGAVELPNRNSYAPAVAERASVGVVELEGNRTVVTTLRGQVNPNSLGLRDHFDVEID